jgi:pimeloyl-ACP methyl ester carboxylesterase
MKRLFVLLLLVCSFAVKSEVISIKSSSTGFFADSADTQTIYFQSKDPKALLIFLPGGPGHYNIQPTQTPPEGPWVMLGNFRKPGVTKDQIDLVLLDSPYAMPNSGLRLRDDHQSRIRDTVKFYKRKTKLPVYLMGHSNGSVSLTEFLKDQDNQKLIDGAIFSGSAIYSGSPSSNNVPILIMHHADDSCHLTPASHAERMFKHISADNKKTTQLKLITGGSETDNPCRSRYSYHMYWEAYDMVSQTVEEFILK